MSKIVFFTDPHVSGKTPAARLDNYPETILGKIRQVGEIAKEINADAVICGGDWFDRPDVGPNIVGRLGAILSGFTCDIFTVIGNHDVYGYNAATVTRSMLGILSGFGIVKRLTNDIPFIVGDFALSGVDAAYELDRDGRVIDYTDGPKEEGKINVRVLHSFLDTKDWPDFVAATNIYNLPPLNSDIILTGHEHTGYGKIVHGGTTYINPGALGRVTASVGDVNKVVQVCILESHEGTDFTVTFRKLDYAPAEEVIDRDRLLREKEALRSREKFLSTLANSNVLGDLATVESFNIYNALADLAAADDIPPKVVKLVQNLLATAEEEAAGSKLGEDDERR